jgi:hypothetical protein
MLEVYADRLLRAGEMPVSRDRPLGTVASGFCCRCAIVFFCVNPEPFMR